MSLIGLGFKEKGGMQRRSKKRDGKLEGKNQSKQVLSIKERK